VLGLVLTYVLIWATLLVLFWAGAAFLQGYIYSEPSSQLYWRAPAAAALITLWLAFWSSREYRAYNDDHVKGRYGAPFEFTATESKPFTEFWVKEGDQKIRYYKQRIPQGSRPGRPEFLCELPPHRPWPGSDAIILKEDNQDVTYTLVRDKKDKEKPKESGGFFSPSTKKTLYRSERGKTITEEMIRFGQVDSTRWGALGLYFFLNAVFLGLWFLGLWLLLRFQWRHALGLAVAFWLTAVIFVVPPLVERIDRFADARPAAAQP
jgi:hypothetical protein